MLPLSASTRIHLAAGSTDLRKGFNGLYGLIRQRHGEEALTGHLYVFCNRRRDIVKIFFWDGTGIWVCAKRLEKGTFHWPAPGTGERLSAPQLAMLLGGLDLPQARLRRWWSEPQKKLEKLS